MDGDGILNLVIIGILLVMVIQGAYLSDKRLLRELISEVRQILDILRAEQKPTGILVTQLGGFMANGVPVGGQGTFQETPLPAGSAFPSGTVISWSADDPLVTLTVSADGSQAVAAVAASDTGISFNLTASALMPGVVTPVTGTLNVPIIPATPPTPTSMQITQIA